MPVLFVFLLKVNIALLLFCAGYYLVLRRLTFYTLNRIYLLTAILFASIYPLINLSSFLQRHEELARPVQQVAINWQVSANSLLIPLNEPDYWHWAEVIFWLGAYILAIRLAVQLFSLYKLYKSSKPAMINDHEVRIIDKDAAPFSFWQSIFVNPAKHAPADLEAILLHEQVHVNEWHTADILLAELSSILYWFNPGIWLMKKAIRENIEFITDRKILNKGIDSKKYQYSLVSVSFNNQQPGIVNHFNISTIKKRIIMMNAKRSSKLNLTRYAFLVPAVITLLFVFSISKADFAKPVRIKLVAAALPLTKIIDFNPDKKPDARPVTAVKHQKITHKAAASLRVASKPDTTKITTKKVLINDVPVETYINGKKGNIKSVDPDDITSIYVLSAEDATPFVDVKPALNNKVSIVITKNSPEGAALKKKIDQSKKSDKYANITTDQHIHTNASSSSSVTVNEAVPLTLTVDSVSNIHYRVSYAQPRTRVSADSTITISNVSVASIPAVKSKVAGISTKSHVIVKDLRIVPTSALSITPATGISINNGVITTGKNTNPLIIIDGNESSSADLKKLNPDKIDNMSVLKGSSITKKYGDKGKDGVILITTKK
ncbi:M56 family metallopeptidase [Mucilaginibacter sabulilitoris]|uniref:M56 family metallopeptidase n=1 Tax=Mucilaginibacter sabulilitoris TaxID=1173583 RepID=A0ABZ0TYP7_9SPHI|nr:M56 family metallopeptidase [Mucilaginibacter sabulilitoris]WPU96620.1 M56 family metallopeptidase [Mucilaginibacter sabulilitoris]